MKYDDRGVGVDLGEERLLTTSPPPRNVPVSAELDIELLYLSEPYLKLISFIKILYILHLNFKWGRNKTKRNTMLRVNFASGCSEKRGSKSLPFQDNCYRTKPYKLLADGCKWSCCCLYFDIQL